MARIPVQVATRGLETGGVVQYPSGSPVAQALEGVGDTLVAAAGHFQQKQRQKESFDAKILESEFTADLARSEDDAVINAPADAAGIHDGVYGELGPTGAIKPGSFDQLFDSYKKRMPASQQADFLAKKEVYRKEGSLRLSEQQYKGEQAYYGVQLQKLQTQITTSMAAGDPNDTQSFSRFKEQGAEAIRASGLPALEKDVALANWDANADETLFKLKLEKDPTFAAKARGALGLAPITGRAPGQGSLVDRIVGVESGGNANAKNPNSSATGAGQFVSGTWMAMVQKYRPDLAVGKSRAEVLALRSDPSLSREMVGNYATENGNALRAAGVEVNDGSLYLAHFAGSGGAISLLRAAPDASARSVLGDAVVDANPFLANKTASQVVAWAANKMNSAVPAQVQADPAFAGISLDRRLVLANQADVQLGQMQRDAEAQATAAYAQHKDSIDLQIVRGQIVDENLILSDPTLNDGDKASALRSLRSQNETSIQLSTDLAALSSKTLVLDPYASKDKTRADNLYTETMKQAGPEQAVAVAGAIFDQTGIVPQPVINTIRKGLASQNPQEVAQAAQTAQRVSSMDPAALGRRDGGSEVQQAADDFSFYVNKLNLDPQEAAKRLIEKSSPEKKFERKALEPAAKEFVKTLQDEDLASNFNDALLWGSDPSIGVSPAQEFGIKAEYLAIAEDQFYAANGDPEIAKNRAIEEMKRLYGVTEFAGGKTIVKHPPERYWPRDDIGGLSVLGMETGLFADPFQYAKTQLYNDVFKIDPDHEPGSIQLIPSTKTDRQVKAGEIPGYSVLWKDKNGVIQTAPGMQWRPDASHMEERVKQRQQKRQDEITERARQADIDTLAGRDREYGLDNLLGDPRAPEPYKPSRRAEPGSNIPTDLPAAPDPSMNVGNPMGDF